MLISNPRDLQGFKIFDHLQVGEQISTFEEYSIMTKLKKISDMLEAFLEKTNRGQVEDDKLRELMIDRYGESFLILEESEKQEVLSITNNVARFIDIGKPPLKADLSDKSITVIEKIISDLQFYARCKYRGAKEYADSLNNVITVSLVLFFYPKFIRRALSTKLSARLDLDKYNDFEISVTPNIGNFQREDLMLMPVQGFTQCTLPEFKVPPTQFIDFIEPPWATRLAELYIYLIVRFAYAQRGSEVECKIEFDRERLLRDGKKKNRPDYTVKVQIKPAKGKEAESGGKGNSEVDLTWVAEVKLCTLNNICDTTKASHKAILQQVIIEIWFAASKIGFLISLDLIIKITVNDINNDTVKIEVEDWAEEMLGVGGCLLVALAKLREDDFKMSKLDREKLERIIFKENAERTHSGQSSGAQSKESEGSSNDDSGAGAGAGTASGGGGKQGSPGKGSGSSGAADVPGGDHDSPKKRAKRSMRKLKEVKASIKHLFHLKEPPKENRAPDSYKEEVVGKKAAEHIPDSGALNNYEEEEAKVVESSKDGEENKENMNPLKVEEGKKDEGLGTQRSESSPPSKFGTVMSFFKRHME